MKRNVLIFIASLVIVACGSSQKAISNTPIETTNEVLEEEIVEETAEEALEEVQETEEIITEIDTAVEEVEAQEEVVETVNYELVEAFDHTSFHNLLVANVSEDGTVNYKGFIQNRKALSEYIRSLGLNLPNDSWTKEDKLAYWMNAYNAMTIDLIIRNYPLKSIKDLKKPWGQQLTRRRPVPAANKSRQVPTITLIRNRAGIGSNRGQATMFLASQRKIFSADVLA